MKHILLPSAVAAALIAAGISAAADTSSWNDDDIMPLLDSLEIMQGDGNGNYGLDRWVSRAEMAKITVNSSSHKDETAIGISVSPYMDVPAGSWASPYILNGASNGLFKGYMDGSFHPDDTVTYEEAVTMVLRVLGYDDDSFGVSYPYGQVNYAKNIDLLDNVGGSYGEPMTRRSIARMIYNALDTDMKTGGRLISLFDASFSEDAVIIATPAEDNTLGTGKVAASTGKYNMYDGFDRANLGLRGDMVIRNGKDMLCFVPDGTLSGRSYTVNNIIGSDLELDGTMIDIDDNTTVYYKSSAYTYKTALEKASRGDSFNIYYDTNGAIEHCVLIPALNAGVNTNSLEKLVIYSVLNNTVIGYKDGAMKEISLKDTTSCYKDTTAYSYSNVKNEMEMGDVLKIKYKSDGDVDYVIYESGNMEGPVQVISQDTLNRFAPDASTTVMRDGNKSSRQDIRTDDIVYYSSGLNMLLAYSNKVSGIYQDASPSRDNPTRVTISGREYNIEGVDAYNALSSSGSFKFGDTITVCMGRDGESIAGVVAGAAVSARYGLVTASGKKNFPNADGTEYSSYYVTLVCADGLTYEYPVKNNTTDYPGKVVKVNISSSGSTVATASNSGISGRVDADNMTIGSDSVSPNCNIIDTGGMSANEPVYKKIYIQRLDGMNLISSMVSYAHKDGSGRIDELILSEATGDAYSYGMVTSSSHSSGSNSVGQLKIDVGGVSQSVTSNNSGLGIGTPCKLREYNGRFSAVSSLKRCSGSGSDLTATTINCGSQTLKLSDEVAVYEESAILSYNKISINDAIAGSYTFTAYCDKDESAGGRVRVIVAVKK